MSQTAVHVTGCSTGHRLQYRSQTTVQVTDCSTGHRLQYMSQTPAQVTDCSTSHRLQYMSQTTVQVTDYSTNKLLSKKLNQENKATKVTSMNTELNKIRKYDNQQNQIKPNRKTK